MILSNNELKYYLTYAGFKNESLEYALKIINCESGNNTLAHNSNNEDSRGLFQINVNAHPNYLIYDLYDPMINVLIGYDLYKKAGYNFKDWSCAKNLGLVYPNNTNVTTAGINNNSWLLLIIPLIYFGLKK